jgi:ferredoxin
VVVLPCRHLCLCSTCHQELERSKPAAQRRCPMDNTAMTSAIAIFLA